MMETPAEIRIIKKSPKLVELSILVRTGLARESRDG
jgi:hypothetical protein